MAIKLTTNCKLERAMLKYNLQNKFFSENQGVTKDYWKYMWEKANIKTPRLNSTCTRYYNASKNKYLNDIEGLDFWSAQVICMKKCVSSSIKQ